MRREWYAGTKLSPTCLINAGSSARCMHAIMICLCPFPVPVESHQPQLGSTTVYCLCCCATRIKHRALHHHLRTTGSVQKRIRPVQQPSSCTLAFSPQQVLRCPSKNHPTDNKLVPGAPDYTTMADAWGVGALLYVTITGRPPFQGANNREVANKILAQDPAITLIFPDHVSQVARDFVTICMQPEAIERPTVYEMMSHPLLAMYGSDHRLPAPKAAAAPNCNAQACIR